jgi:hypothetical protein
LVGRRTIRHDCTLKRRRCTNEGIRAQRRRKRNATRHARCCNIQASAAGGRTAVNSRANVTACLTCPAKCVTANVVPFFFAFVYSFSYLLGFRLAPAGLRPRALPRRTKRARTRSYAVQRSAEADPSGRDKAFDRQRRMRAAQLIPAQMWAGAGPVPARMWAG